MQSIQGKSQIPVWHECVSVHLIVFARWTEWVICDLYPSGLVTKTDWRSYQKMEEMWQASSAPGTISLHPSFIGRPAWGFATTRGSTVNRIRFSKLDQIVDARAFPEPPLKNCGAKFSSCLFHFPGLAPPNIPQWGTFQAVDSGWQVCSEVLIGTPLWMASNLPGVWLEQSEKPWWDRPCILFCFLAGKTDKLSVNCYTCTLGGLLIKGHHLCCLHFLLVLRTLHLSSAWVLGAGKD